MSTADQDYIKTVEEYKNFDIDGFKSEIMHEFDKETSVLNQNEDAHKGDGLKQISQYERLHTEHKDLQSQNLKAGEVRKETLDSIQKSTLDHDAYSKDSTVEKRGLRDNITDLEDTLRRLKDQLSNSNLENKNLQLVVDTESALRGAKATAEVTAVSTVNSDLKDQVDRIDLDIKEETEKKEEASRILQDLTTKHEDAKKSFEDLLKEAEGEKKKAEKELNDLKSQIQNQNRSNQNLNTEVEKNEKVIAKLGSEISQLNSDLNELKIKNRNDIQILEEQRKTHESTVTDLRTQLTKADHDSSILQILIQKTVHELEYLSSEKDKHQSQNYQKRIENFSISIEESEKKAQYLNEELSRMNAEWNDRLQRTVRETEQQIRSNENDDFAKRIEELVQLLQVKNEEINELKRRRDELEAKVDTESTEQKSDKIDEDKAELEKINQALVEALDAKNKLYDELTDNTKQLLDTNETIQKNAQEIARLSQDLEFLKKELEQKEKIVYDLRIELEQKKQLIEDLKEEVEEKKQLIEQLQQTLQDRENEAEKIKEMIAQSEAQIAELAEQLELANAPETPDQSAEKDKDRESDLNYVPDTSDEVDQMLAKFINLSNCPVPIKRLGGGYYLFGTKKIFAKILNGRLVIRVGGGYMVIDEFIQTYAQQELLKIQARRAAGEDPFELDDHGSPKRGYTTGSPRSSGKGSPKNANGSARSKTITSKNISKMRNN